jgi:uncharacterized protein
MKLRLEQIHEEPKTSIFDVPGELINARFAAGTGEPAEFRLVTPLHVDVAYYRAGEDLYLRGTLRARMEASCARCLATFSRELETPFQVVMVPQPAEEMEEPPAEDLSLSYFSGNEVDLEPLIGEQAILSLPTRAICRSDCRGLCTVCGADLNVESCGCSRSEPDPRWAALRQWRPSRAS